MRISILSDRAADVIHMLALALVVGASFLSLPAAGDPYQPMRGLAVSLAGVLVALAVVGRRASAMPGPAASALLVCIIVLTVVSALANGPASAVFGVHGRFQGLVSGLAAVVALATGLASHRKVRLLPRIAAVAVVAQAGVVAAQAIGGGSPVGTMGNQVLAGGWMAVATAIVAAGARAERGRLAAALWAASGVGAVALGVIGSRGAWIGLAFAALALVMTSRSLRPRLVASIGAAAVVTVIGGALIGGPASLAKLDPAALASGSADARVAIWRGTAALIVDNPILGVGPGRFLYDFARYEPVEHARLEPEVRPDQAHSIPLHLAAESGVPAAIAGVALTVLAIAASARRARAGDGGALIALAGVTAWAGQALFGIATIETDALALACAGIALAGAQRVRAERGRELPGQRGIAVAASLLITSAVLMVTTVGYLRADVAHGRGLDAFAAGRFDEAWRLQWTAIERNPLVDIYRASLGDVAQYGGGSVSAALASVGRGVELEPRSYDLVLAKARLLSAAGADPVEVSDTYQQALALYPLGITVSYEAIDAAIRAGLDDRARDVAEALLETYPDDPVVGTLVEGIESGR